MEQPAYNTQKTVTSSAASRQSNGFLYDFLTVICKIIIIITFPISGWFVFEVVSEYERAIIMRLGRVKEDENGGQGFGPGYFFNIPCLDEIKKVDIRTVTFDVPPQMVMTKDSVTIRIDAIVYYKIVNPMLSVIAVEDAPRSTKLLAATSLRNILGSKTLTEISSDRKSIALAIQEELDVATDPWGIKVERVEIKDFQLPPDMQRAMAAEAEAQRDAKAKIVAAKGEAEASRALKEAADVIGQSNGALQLRYLQSLQSIAAEKNSTIIFPIPMDLVSK